MGAADHDQYLEKAFPSSEKEQGKGKYYVNGKAVITFKFVDPKTEDPIDVFTDTGYAFTLTPRLNPLEFVITMPKTLPLFRATFGRPEKAMSTLIKIKDKVSQRSAFGRWKSKFLSFKRKASERKLSARVTEVSKRLSQRSPATSPRDEV